MEKRCQLTHLEIKNIYEYLGTVFQKVLEQENYSDLKKNIL
jgi:hypothetical protein